MYNSLAWIRGIESGNTKISENVWIGPFCVIDGEYDKLTIGRGVNVSSGTQIITHDTVKRCLTGKLLDIIEHSPILIEDFVYIGANAVILKGCIIGHHSVIAAGAVLKENSIIPPFSLVAGVPGKVKKNIENSYRNWIENDKI